MAPFVVNKLRGTGIRIFFFVYFSGELKHTLNQAKVSRLSFSPQGTYLLTWNKQEDKEGEAPPATLPVSSTALRPPTCTENLLVWDVATGSQVAKLFEKTVDKSVSLTRLSLLLPPLHCCAG